MFNFPVEIFNRINQVIEPVVRAGFGNPILWPTGAIVVETTGRKSGRKINLPVLATRIGDWVIFSTIRRDAQWLKNLAANPNVRYWLAGQSHEAKALIVTPEQPIVKDAPPQATSLNNFLQYHSRLLGISFALLTPRS